MRKYIGIIPARLNSTRFPAKLLAPIKGKTLLQHTYLQATKYKDLHEIYIATDSKEIAEALENVPAILFTSSTPESGTERIVEALSQLILEDSTVIFNLQGDHPFTSAKTISKLISLFEKDATLEVATAACKSTCIKDFLSPHVVKCVVDNEQNALYFSRSPIPYQMDKENISFLHHLGVYAYTKEFLHKFSSFPPSKLEREESLEQLRILENNISLKVAIVDDLSIGIDTKEDLERHMQVFV